MRKFPHVLMVTRPIAPPWNESSKNLAYNLAQYSTRYPTHVMTLRGKARVLGDHVIEEPIYTADPIPLNNLPVPQKIRVLARLMSPDRSIGLYHFLLAPKGYQSRLFATISRSKQKKTVQSILCRITGQEEVSNLFFGDEIVTFSEFTKQKIAPFTSRPITKIDPGVDLTKFPMEVDREGAKRLFGFENRRIVLFCGDYTPEQGPWKLLQAIPALATAIPDVLVVFAARSKNELLEHQQDMKKTIRERDLSTHACMLEEESRIADLIAASDVGILPADVILRKLDIPLVLLEFLAMGRPIVISDIPPLNEVMRDEVGVLLRNTDSDTIAEALENLLSHPDHARRLGRAGRALVERDFTVNRMAAAYDEVYDRLVS